MELKDNLKLIGFLKRTRQMTYIQIAKTLQQLGVAELNVSSQQLSEIIRELYEKETEKRNLNSTQRVLSLYKKGYTLDEIEQIIEQMGIVLARNTVIYTISNNMTKQGKVIMPNEVILRDAVLNGKTIPRYTQEERLQIGMKEALRKLKEQKGQTLLSHQDFSRVLRYMEGTEGGARIHNCEMILSSYLKERRLSSGQVEVLQNRHFPENPLEFTYIFIHFCRRKGVSLAQIDKDVLFAYRQRLAKQVDDAIERGARISHSTDLTTKNTKDGGER